MKQWILATILLISLVSCEKTLNLAPAAAPAKLVVDASIENGIQPVVILNRSLNYFSTLDPLVLSNSFVHNAVVTIQEGNTVYPLKEIEFTNSNGVKFYYYSNPPQNANNLLGQLGKQYQLRIETEGQVYTSSASIPLLTKKIDSLWWKPAPKNPDTTKVVMLAKVSDPPGLGNYIRYFTKVNQESFLPGANSVFDDDIIDGKTYDVQVDRGIDKNVDVSDDEYGFFKRGDTVVVKFCNISKATYDFWRTWEFTYQSIGNPFSSPGKIISNISNNGLGVFAGYAAQYKTLVIPK